MDPVLELISSVLPMTFAYDALDQVARGTGDSAGSATAVVGFALLALAAGAATLRRRSA